MLFSYDKPKSQAYRTARFEAIQKSKKFENSINFNPTPVNFINSLTEKIYNNDYTNVKVNPSPIIKVNPSPIIKVNPSPIIKVNRPIIKVNRPIIKVNHTTIKNNFINSLTKKSYTDYTDGGGYLINSNLNMMKNTNVKVKRNQMIKVNPSPIIKVNPSPMIKVNYPINEINNEEKKKILVLYVYHIYNDRVKSFIENCIFYDENIDFIIISNNKNDKNNNTLKNITNVKLFLYKNVKILFRDNVGYDFGGWSDALLTDNFYEKYNNFIFVNSSVIGPFLPSDYKGKWTDLYINGLKDNVKLFGSTINADRNPHVQSYIFSMDKTTLKYLIDCSIFSKNNYSKTFKEAVHTEVSMSKKIIENNWNIGCLMTYYKNVDFTFRNKKPNDYNIKFLNDVVYPMYRNKIWNEYELVFIKGNRNIKLEPAQFDHIYSWENLAQLDKLKILAQLDELEILRKVAMRIIYPILTNKNKKKV